MLLCQMPAVQYCLAPRFAPGLRAVCPRATRPRCYSGLPVSQLHSATHGVQRHKGRRPRSKCWILKVSSQRFFRSCSELTMWEQVDRKKGVSAFKAGHDGDHQDARAIEGKSPLQRSKLLSLGAAKSAFVEETFF